MTTTRNLIDAIASKDATAIEGAFNVAPTQVDVQGDAVVVVDDEYFFGGISLSQANLGTISNAIDALKFEKGKVGEPIAWFALSISYVIIS